MRLAPGQTTAAIGAGVRADAARRRAGGRDGRGRALVDGRARARRPEAPAIIARAGRVRARPRRAAAARPLGRLDPGRRGPRRPRHSRHRHGFARPTSPNMHSPNEHIPAASLREGLETTVEVSAPARPAWLTPATRAHSRKSSATTCSSASSATSAIDTEADPSSTTYPEHREAARSLATARRRAPRDRPRRRRADRARLCLRDRSRHGRGRADDRADRTRRHVARGARRRRRADRPPQLRRPPIVLPGDARRCSTPTTCPGSRTRSATTW